MKEYEFSGKTVEEAVEEGLAALSLTREQAEIVVLEEGKMCIRDSSNAAGCSVSGTSSSPSRYSKVRSAEASADCSELIMYDVSVAVPPRG